MMWMCFLINCSSFYIMYLYIDIAQSQPYVLLSAYVLSLVGRWWQCLLLLLTLSVSALTYTVVQRCGRPALSYVPRSDRT
jgi:hypothetical protein